MAATSPTSSALARIMYWTFIVSVVATFVLSYPPTQYVVEGIRGPVTFSTRMGLAGFIVTLSCSASS